MDEKKNLTIIFILSLLVSLIALGLCLINFSKVFCVFYYQMLFFSGLITLFFCIFSLKKLFAEIRYDVKLKESHERNVRDVYRYKLMMDPPDWDT